MNRLKQFYLIIAILFGVVGIATVGAEVYSYQKLLNTASGVAEQNYRAAKVDERNEIMQSIEKNYTEIEPDINALNVSLPDKKDASKLLYDLNALATESQLKLSLYQTSPTNTKKQVTPSDLGLLQTVSGKYGQELPLDLKAEGSFFYLSSFILKLEKYQRLVNITTLEISQPDDRRGSDFVEAKIKLTAYLKK